MDLNGPLTTRHYQFWLPLPMAAMEELQPDVVLSARPEPALDTPYQKVFAPIHLHQCTFENVA